MVPNHIIPLGVSGTVTVSREQYLVSVEREPGPDTVLADESARIAYVAQRLDEALDRPLTSQGSSELARSVLTCFEPSQLLAAFAEKAIETLRDGKSHSRMAVSSDEPRAAALFVAWSGTHRDVMPIRRGRYLEPFFATATKITQAGVQLAGFLQIDAYLRENVDAACPGRPLSEVFEVDVEFSYVPGFAIGGSNSDSELPNAFLVNLDLCSPEERQLLSKLTSMRR
jgi:hypothetical protein